MIFLVKGPVDLGSSRFSQRLAEHLDLEPPPWPVSEEMLTSWSESLDGWEGDPDFFLGARHVDIDRIVALVVWENRHLVPPPPQGDRREFERWRDRHAVQVATRRRDRVFEILYGMIDAVEHVVVDGLELGTSPRDTPISRALLARYSHTPTLRILLRKASDGDAAAPTVAMEVNRKLFTETEILARIRRAEAGDVVLAPELQSARTRKL